MKIILTENQIRLIEQVEGMDDFVNKITEKYFNDDLPGDYKEFQNMIKTSIENSGCKNINFARFKYPAGGAATNKKVYINIKNLDDTMEDLIYIIFHEIAHQYQLKKYGDDNLYQIYTGDISLEDGVKYIRKLETVADEFGLRKLREFIKKGFLTGEYIPVASYKQISDISLKSMLNQMIQYVRTFEDKSKEGITNTLFNLVVAELV